MMKSKGFYFCVPMQKFLRAHAKIPACPRINSNVGTQFLGQGFMFLFYINKFPIWKTRADTTHANSVV